MNEKKTNEIQALGRWEGPLEYSSRQINPIAHPEPIGK
jgi:hypothetical protein